MQFGRPLTLILEYIGERKPLRRKVRPPSLTRLQVQIARDQGPALQLSVLLTISSSKKNSDNKNHSPAERDSEACVFQVSGKNSTRLSTNQRSDFRFFFTFITEKQSNQFLVIGLHFLFT